MLPSPEYEFSIEQIAGAALVGICVVGMVVAAVDDLTGVGVADNALFVPLSAGVSKGLIMMFP